MSRGPAWPDWRRLRAGDFEAGFVPADGTLRDLRWRGEEVVRAIYGAVRDRDWGTVPVVLAELVIREEPDAFHVSFLADARPAGVPFAWRGAIEARADGTLAYTFAGTAEGPFLRNRIGLCVLHPPECAGGTVAVEHGDGTRVAGAFPARVAPHQPFLDLRALTHTTPAGTTVTVRWEGETFEMEDQRNWTDASFKTYGTPLARPFPVAVGAGDTVRQSVSLACVSTAPLRPRPASAPAAGRAGTLQPAGDPVPQTPLGLLAGSAPLSPAERENVRAAAPAFLRLDVHPGAAPGWADRLAAGLALAADLGAAVELAVRLDGAEEPALAALAGLVAGAAPGRVPRVLALRRDRPVVAAGDVARLRTRLAPVLPGAAFGGGTDAWYAELNRGRPGPEGFDFLSFSITPQVHAFDDRSLVETLAMQAVVVRDARALAGGRPVVVSPITFLPRYNPNATGPDAAPRGPDPRQGTAFAALWTLGSIGAVAGAGATAACYDALTGPPGADPASPPPPVARLLRELAPFRGGHVEPVASSHPLDVEALVVGGAGRRLLLLANFGPATPWHASAPSLQPRRARLVTGGSPGPLDPRAPLPPGSLVAADLPPA